MGEPMTSSRHCGRSRASTCPTDTAAGLVPRPALQSAKLATGKPRGDRWNGARDPCLPMPPTGVAHVLLCLECVATHRRSCSAKHVGHGGADDKLPTLRQVSCLDLPYRHCGRSRTSTCPTVCKTRHGQAAWRPVEWRARSVLAHATHGGGPCPLVFRVRCDSSQIVQRQTRRTWGSR